MYFKCVCCGLESQRDKARFCQDCGAEKNWIHQEIDQGEEIGQYIAKIGEFFFDNHSDTEIEKFSLRHRARLKITLTTHVEILKLLGHKKKSIAELSKFRIEFNQNVKDAFAGHDTFLEFKITNLNSDERLKANLIWDDLATPEVVDLRAETKSYINPSASTSIGAKVIFSTAGIKEISDLVINITDDFGRDASFRAEPFRFKVVSLDQKLVQNISTHNQISIEGRGVVDASGMGVMKSEKFSGNLDIEKWMDLSFVYLSEAKFYMALEKAVIPNTINELFIAEDAEAGLLNESEKHHEINDDEKLTVFSSNEGVDILYIHSSGNFSLPNCETSNWYGEIEQSFKVVSNLGASTHVAAKRGAFQWNKRVTGDEL